MTVWYLWYYLLTFSWFVKAYGVGFFTLYWKEIAFKWNNLNETISFCVWHSKMFILISILFWFFLCMWYKVQKVALRLIVSFCILKKLSFLFFSLYLLYVELFLRKESIIKYFKHTCKAKAFWWVRNIFSISFCYNGWFYCLRHHHGPSPINLISLVFHG